MSIRKIIREELRKVFEADYYDRFPDFIDPLFNPQMGRYPPVGMHAYGTIVTEEEEIKLDRSSEEQKLYKFYLICDKLCELEGVEVKNQMIADSMPVRKEEFVENCVYSESLLFYENINISSDPSMAFYKSEVKGVPCYYVQYAGFEFIFIKNGAPGNEYWLEEMWDVDGNYIY